MVYRPRDDRERRVLIRGATILTMNQSRDVLLNQDLLVVGTQIAAIGDLSHSYHVVHQLIDAHGLILIPGLIQTHLHLSQTLFRNLVDETGLARWLDVILRLEASHDPDSNYWSAMLGIAELLLGGTTAIGCFDTVHLAESCFEAIRQTGIRAFAGKRMLDRPVPGVKVPPELVQPAEVAFSESLALFEQWDGRDGGRIRYCFCPGSAIDCTNTLLGLIADYSAKRGALVNMHAAESRRDVEAAKQLKGMPEILYLESMGLLTPRTVLAHCVHVNDQEIERLGKGGAHVAHAPTADLYLASGIAPIPALIKEGASVGLTADAAADAHSLDIFRVMRSAASLQRGVSMDPEIQPTAESAFTMATLGGARSLGLEEEIGSIEVGKRADLVLLDLRRPHTWPNEAILNAKQNIYTRIVYSAKATDVVMTMVNGRVLMRGRHLLSMDLGEVMRQSNRAIQRVLRRAGFPN